MRCMLSSASRSKGTSPAAPTPPLSIHLLGGSWGGGGAARSATKQHPLTFYMPPLSATQGIEELTLSAVCQVRVMTSPTLPMAWESEDIAEMAPMSCMMSSAAIVSPLTRTKNRTYKGGNRGEEGR